MSMVHEFGVLQRTDKDYGNKKAWRRSDYRELKCLMKDKVELHDDVVQYIADSMKWIRWFDPSTQTDRQDLSYYGITVLLPTNATHAAQVFNAWADLLDLSPSKVRLSGANAWKGELTHESGHYQELSLSRDKLVSSLRALADGCTRIASSDGSEYLLHFGI